MAKANANRTFNKDLSSILTKLWNVDDNRCVAGIDYKLNLQGYVTATRGNLRDRAKDKLFSYFNENVIFSKPTYAAFIALLDNYKSDVNEAEMETELEVEEVEKFMSAILKTRVMKETHDYLRRQNMTTDRMEDFKKLLHDIWFKMYRRAKSDQQVNSCGFEHVFVGENRSKEVIGFHNWVQIYLQEKLGNLDYRGHFRRGTTEELEMHPRLVSLQFLWKGDLKPIGSSLIGTSPEFEMAMYTIVLLCGRCSSVTGGDSCSGGRSGHKGVCVHLDKYDVELVALKHGPMGIGTAYPISLAD